MSMLRLSNEPDCSIRVNIETMDVPRLFMCELVRFRYGMLSRSRTDVHAGMYTLIPSTRYPVLTAFSAWYREAGTMVNSEIYISGKISKTGPSWVTSKILSMPSFNPWINIAVIHVV